MKRLSVVIVAIVLLCMPSQAGSHQSWYCSAGERVGCKKISMGTSRARVMIDQGKKIKIPASTIESYCSEGLIFEKKAILQNGRPNGKTVFMQRVAAKGELTLFRNVETASDRNQGIRPFHRFYVYQGDDLYLIVNQRFLEDVFRFFQLKPTFR